MLPLLESSLGPGMSVWRAPPFSLSRNGQSISREPDLGSLVSLLALTMDHIKVDLQDTPISLSGLSSPTE